MKEKRKACVVTIATQKGGAGKTTTAAALISGLSRRGYKTLGIDTDAQRNLSFAMRATISEGEASIIDLFLQDAGTEEIIRQTPEGDIIPAEENLAAISEIMQNAGTPLQDFSLQAALKPLLSLYDFIVIDTPPNLGPMTINALTAADKVIIPAEAAIYSVLGTGDAIRTIQAIKQSGNPRLTIDGILLTQTRKTSVTSELKAMFDTLATNNGTRIYKATIRQGVAVDKAIGLQESIFNYAPKAGVSQDYNDFITEFLKGENQ
jgi:chromosome partitioning protein